MKIDEKLISNKLSCVITNKTKSGVKRKVEITTFHA